MLLNLAIGKGFHEALVKVADIEIFNRHLMKYAVIRLNYRLTPRQGRVFCVITKLIHYFGQLLDLFLLGVQLRILATYLVCYACADFRQALAHVFGPLFTLYGGDNQLGKPGVFSRKAFLTKLGKDIKLLRAASSRRARRTGSYQ